jgi:SAM-dependent methyltransferase
VKRPLSSFASFSDACQGLLGHQDIDWTRDYLAEHELRLYETYRLCRSANAKTVLSIGAGAAFIEGVLAEDGVAVTVIDFPSMIEARHRYYATMGFREIPADIVGLEDYPSIGQFDLVLASEVLEHIPLPPTQLIARWFEAVRPGGTLIVTTPNLGSISHIARLVAMRPLLPPPERTFSPVAIENEGVHRREYMPAEVVEAVTAAGLSTSVVAFVVNGRARSRRALALRAFHVIPRFRPTMMVSATRPSV